MISSTIMKKNSNNNFNYTFFSKDTIDGDFKRIKEELIPNMDSKELMSKFHKILKNRIVPIQTFNKDSSEFFIYRVTTIFDDFNPNIAKSYSYNPTPNEDGRAHKAGFPVFYGALDVITAILEMKGRLDNGQKFYLSRWKIKFETETAIHPLLINSETIKTSHIIAPFAREMYSNIEKKLSNISKKNFHSQMYAIKKMGDLYTTPTNSLYHITSAYSHEVIYGSISKVKNVEILLYPSVENNLFGINMAIHPNFVNSNNMVLNDVFEVNIKENNFRNLKGNITLSLNRKAKVFEEKITIWETLISRIIKIDYDQIIIKTNDGTILDSKNSHKIILHNKKATIKDLIDYSIKTIKVEEYLLNVSFNQDEESFLDFSIKEYETILFLNLENGYRIITDNRKSDISEIYIPITYLKYFQEIS